MEAEIISTLARPSPDGALAAFRVSDKAAAITGNISYVDAGYHAAW
jgi:enoyl-[acyl-carrier-protein] reductase (NADH)